jgi:hypothetical protein
MMVVVIVTMEMATTAETIITRATVPNVVMTRTRRLRRYKVRTRLLMLLEKEKSTK